MVYRQKENNPHNDQTQELLQRVLHGRVLDEGRDLVLVWEGAGGRREIGILFGLLNYVVCVGVRGLDRRTGGGGSWW